jgi:integrase/recombinase XerD
MAGISRNQWPTSAEYASGRSWPRRMQALGLAVQHAARQYPELARRRVHPHLIRHSLARLLQSGVDITVIALWLSHESTVTTHMYDEADLAMKERALKTLQAPKSKHVRYRPPDAVLEFLQGL